MVEASIWNIQRDETFKRVLLNERALNLEKFNAFKVETLMENVKRQIYVEGVTTT